MKPQALSAKHGSTGSLAWIGGVLVIGIVLVGAWLTIDTMVRSPNIWELMDRERAAEIEQEDRAICARFGMEPETDAFGSCAQELANVRWLQSQRDQRSRF